MPDFQIEDQDSLLALLDELGVQVSSQTRTHFIAYCPFHDNRDTPAFNIDKTIGVWRCWNPGCAQTGTLEDLVARINNLKPTQAVRFVISRLKGSPVTRRVRRVLQSRVREVDPIDESVLLGLDFDISRMRYLLDRGYSEETIRHFGVGWDGERVCIPVRDEKGRLLGLTRRAVTPARQKYLDPDLPKSVTLFNIQNAVGHREVIVVEGPLDAMKVHQSGFPNVVATMMGSLSDDQKKLLVRNFDSVSIFTDNDDAGRKLGEMIERSCEGKRVYWVPYLVDAKDPGEMSEDDIRRCIGSKISSLLRKISGGCGNMVPRKEMNN